MELSKEELNDKRLVLLEEANKKNLNATRLLKKISRDNSIPESTLWFNLRKLEELGFLNFGNGFPVTLTFAGRIVLKELKS